MAIKEAVKTIKIKSGEWLTYLLCKKFITAINCLPKISIFIVKFVKTLKSEG